MPICKYCHSRITRFDKDICPICGVKKPLEGVSSETVEITSNFNLNDEELKTFRPHTKVRTLLFYIFLGWTGAPQFYLHYVLQGFICLFINLAIMAGLFFLCYFPLNLGLMFSIIIPVGAIYLINILIGVIVYFKHNLKDHNGEFLR